jgi:hypothetical protein
VKLTLNDLKMSYCAMDSTSEIILCEISSVGELLPNERSIRI